MEKKRGRKRKSRIIVAAFLKVREGDRTVYKGRVQFSLTAKNPKKGFVLKTRTRRTNPFGFALVETYVMEENGRWFVCAFRKPLETEDESIIFHFLIKRGESHASSIGRRQSSGTEMPHTALLIRK
jgi:hypothetical protein